MRFCYATRTDSLATSWHHRSCSLRLSSVCRAFPLTKILLCCKRHSWHKLCKGKRILQGTLQGIQRMSPNAVVLDITKTNARQNTFKAVAGLQKAHRMGPGVNVWVLICEARWILLLSRWNPTL